MIETEWERETNRDAYRRETEGDTKRHRGTGIETEEWPSNAYGQRDTEGGTDSGVVKRCKEKHSLRDPSRKQQRQSAIETKGKRDRYQYTQGKKWNRPSFPSLAPYIS